MTTLKTLSMAILLAILLVSMSHAYVEASNLNYFVRMEGSLDPNVSTVIYLNGSIFGKQSGSRLQKLFNYEGYNINRKISNPDGSVVSLSREFVVYRNPITSEILRVWMNPWTSTANEVFFVANDPVNGNFQKSTFIPMQIIRNDVLVMNSDIVLEYPNALPPAKYPKYSAGFIYDSVELFGFFANYTLLSESRDKSVPMTGTWFRKSQYLPWMEMGSAEGSLYYATMAWKCNEGLSCVAPDIMELIVNHYSKYKKAPTTYVEPNETSWTVFKKIIDQRRQTGLPDIIIPDVNVTANVSAMTTCIDARVMRILEDYKVISFTLNGSAWSEVIGNDSIMMFNFLGFGSLHFEHLPSRDGFIIKMDINIRLIDSDGNDLHNWTNPITGQLIELPFLAISGDSTVKNDSIYTVDMPSSKAVGLIVAQALDGQGVKGDEWAVNFAELIFEYIPLDNFKPGDKPNIYGTFATFCSWPAFMKMAGIPGNLVTKATAYV